MKTEESKLEEQLIDFFKWFNDYEELKYTEKVINFYVDKYLNDRHNKM